MEINIDGFSMKVYCYMCTDCDERFYIEELREPTEVACTKCGEFEVGISSDHLDELNALD